MRGAGLALRRPAPRSLFPRPGASRPSPVRSCVCLAGFLAGPASRPGRLPGRAGSRARGVPDGHFGPPGGCPLAPSSTLRHAERGRTSPDCPQRRHRGDPAVRMAPSRTNRMGPLHMSGLAGLSGLMGRAGAGTDRPWRRLRLPCGRPDAANSRCNRPEASECRCGWAGEPCGRRMQAGRCRWAGKPRPCPEIWVRRVRASELGPVPGSFEPRSFEPRCAAQEAGAGRKPGPPGDVPPREPGPGGRVPRAGSGRAGSRRAPPQRGVPEGAAPKFFLPWPRNIFRPGPVDVDTL